MTPCNTCEIKWIKISTLNILCDNYNYKTLYHVHFRLKMKVHIGYIELIFLSKYLIFFIS